MTRKADSNARLNTFNSLSPKSLEVYGISLHELEIKELTVKEVRGFISLFHYSKLMPDSTKYVYGAIYKGQIVGVVCFGMGTTKSQYTSVIPNIKQGEYLELTRLWCLHTAPHNMESYLISRSLKLLPKNVRLVLSYADEGKGHYGTIYQATNWLYIGATKGARRLVDEFGQELNTRTLSIYRQRRPELADKSSSEIVEYLNCRYIEGTTKHKYIYLRGNKREVKEMLKIVSPLIQDYPKGDKLDYKTDIDIYLEYKAGGEN